MKAATLALSDITNQPFNLDKEMQELMQAARIKNEELIKRSEIAQIAVGKQSEATAAILANTRAQNENSLMVLEAQKLAALENQNKVQAQASALGINPGVSSEVLDRVSTEWKAATLDTMNKSQKLREDSNIKFLDKPIDYIVAQITMEGTVKDLEMANANRAAVANALGDVQNITQKLPGQMAALAKNTSETLIAKEMAIAKTELDSTLQKKIIEAAGLDLQGINLLNSMDEQQLRNKGITVNLLQENENRNRAKEQFALQKQQFQFQLEEKRERALARDADAAAIKDMADTVKMGAATMGYKDIVNFPESKIIQLLRTKNLQFEQFYESGLKSQVAGRGIVSESSGQAAAIIAQTDAPMRPEQKEVKDFIVEAFGMAQDPKYAVTKGYNHTKLPEVINATSGLIDKRAKDAMGNIDYRDQKNPYAPPPLPSIMNTPAVQKTAFFQTVMKDQMAVGNLKETNPDQLISIARAGIKSGKLTHAQAIQGLETVFKSAVLINNANKNYVGVGMPNQAGFNTKPDTGFKGKRAFDLTDPTQLNLIIMKAEQEETMRGLTGSPFSQSLPPSFY